MMDHKKPGGCVIPLKALAWNWHTVTSAYISLTKASHVAKPNINWMEKYLSTLLGRLEAKNTHV